MVARQLKGVKVLLWLVAALPLCAVMVGVMLLARRQPVPLTAATPRALSPRAAVESPSPEARADAAQNAEEAVNRRATVEPSPSATPAPPLPPALAAKIRREARGRDAYDEPEKAAEFYRLKRLPVGAQEVPVERYLEAHARMREMRRYAAAEGRFLPPLASINPTGQGAPATEGALAGAWEPLGPGNIGGRTRALLIHPTNPSVMYAAGVSGGVWKTTNGGATWTPLADLMANLAVCSMAFDPQNPEVIYAGTGEGFYNADGLRGAGVFKTSDGGATWVHLASTNTSDFHYVNDLVISPHDSRRMYAATRTGVWRSDDGGGSWARTLQPKEEQLGGCVDLALSAGGQKDVLFASVSMARPATVYRNTDAGGAGEWVAVLSEYGMQRTSLAVAPSNPDVVYALSTGNVDAAPFSTGSQEPNGLYAVFRSTAGGAPDTWTSQVKGNDAVKLNRLLLANPILATLNECGFGRNIFYSQGWYNNVIAVDPKDENRVWVGGTDLFRSDDGGKNWGIASHWWPDIKTPQYAHADHHVIAFHPRYDGAANKTMFVGNDGGLFRTDDARAGVAAGAGATCVPTSTGTRWVSLNNNYAVTQFYHGLPFPDGKTYFGGTQDNGTILGASAGGPQGWREIMGGDGGFVAVDQTNPQVLYAETPSFGFRKSTDGGRTFSSARLGSEFFLGGDSYLFVTPFVMDPSDARRLYTGGISIWRTNDAAAHWEIIGDSVGTGSGQVSAIAVAPTDSNYVLVGKTSGLIHRQHRALALDYRLQTPFGGELDWPRVFPQSGEDKGGYVSGLAFDPTDKNIAYATVSSFGAKHVWQSLDAGATWRPLDGAGPTGLPDVPALSVAVDPANTRRIFVGTDVGVFASVDGGATWAVENTGFANAPVEALKVINVGGENWLYAFTYGRGAWRVSLGAGCATPTLAPVSESFGVGGGAGRVRINAGPHACPASASSNADWITVTASGADEVAYAVAANPEYKKRWGTLTVGGHSFAVVQEGRKDTEAPVVNFTAPVPTGGTFITSSGYVTVAGTMKDDRAVTCYSVVRDDRPAGPYLPGCISTAPQPPTFTLEGLSLEVGVNTLTAIAQDAERNNGRASIKVIFQPKYMITSLAGVSWLPGFAGDGSQALRASLHAPNSVARDRQGNLFIADSSNGRIRRIDAKTGVIRTVAGKGYPDGVESRGDGGPAVDAVFAIPRDVAVDGAGNIYIAEYARIRKVGLDGIINTVAGNGTVGYGGDGGPATAAKINGGPMIALDPAGTLYIVDTHNHRIRRVGPDGVITTVAGTGPGFGGDGGPATQAQLKSPSAITFDEAGNLYISDGGNYRVRKVAAGTGAITTIAGNGGEYSLNDGVAQPALGAPLGFPMGLVVDRAGNVFVSASGRLRRISPDGPAWKLETVAGGGSTSEDNLPASFAGIVASRLELDDEGSFYFADSGSHRIRKVYPLRLMSGPPTINITAPSATGSFTSTERLISLSGTTTPDVTVARLRWRSDRGYSGTATGGLAWKIDEVPLLAGLNRITVTAEDPLGNSRSAMIAVTYNPPTVIRRVAGTSYVSGFAGDGGPATAALLWEPRDVAADRFGNLYIADRRSHRVRRVAPDGTITTYAGNGDVGSGGDGGQATAAELNQPHNVAVDADGNLYIADTMNNRVRRVTPAGVISTVAGDGLNDFGGDGGPAERAHLSEPRGLAVDPAGNLYIADTGNHRVRRIDARLGIITTFAGGGGVGAGGDGGAATAAQLDTPLDVAVDRVGNVYVTDWANKCLRRVDAAGTISTFVRDVNAYEYGAPFFNRVTFTGLEVDQAGNVYVISQATGSVRRFTPDGVETTYAGGVRYYETGDGGAATGAGLASTTGLGFDQAGNLYIADPSNYRVMAVSEYRAAASVSAAHYRGPEAAAESIVTAFGTSLASAALAAQSLPLPTALGGTRVVVRDNLGVGRHAPLFYVSPTQVNYLVPAGTAPGAALVTVTNAQGVVSYSSLEIVSAAPGVFSADATGQGLAAALVQRVRADGSQVYEPVARYDEAARRFVAVTVDVSDANEQAFLLLFGTGLRGSGGAGAAAQIGGENAEVLYAGPQGSYAGLDQVNVRLPRTLAGRGEVDVVLSVGGQTANTVRVRIR
jgi:uncharacterized protein (TIGR03437 family)